MRPNRTYAWIAFLFIAATVVAATVSTGAAPAPGPVGRAGGAPPDLEGAWFGQWADTVFAVTGPMEWDIEVNGPSVTLTGTNDLSGVGLGSMEPLVLTGVIVGDSLAYDFMFTGSSALTSTGDGLIVGAAADNLAGTGNVGAPLGFGDYTYTGTATTGVIWGTFTYSGGGAGTFTMLKSVAVEPESWGHIKARHRSGG